MPLIAGCPDVSGLLLAHSRPVGRAVERVGGTWTREAQFGWQVQVKPVELVDHLDRRGVVAFLVAYTTHLGPVRAAEAVERFGDRVFEVIRDSPEDLCAIKGITPSRARAVHESFAQVATIANVDSWLRHIGLGKADARRVREAYGDDAARLVRENPYRLADDIHGVGFVTADSLRVMLGIGRSAHHSWLPLAADSRSGRPGRSTQSTGQQP